RSPRHRAEVGGALTSLLAGAVPGAVLASSPVFVPERRRLAEQARDAVAPPSQLVRPLVGAVRGLLDRARHGPSRRPGRDEPVPITPGSLGSWTDDTAGVTR